MKPAFLFFLCCSLLLLSGSNPVQLRVSFSTASAARTAASTKTPVHAVLQSRQTAVQPGTATSNGEDVPNAIEPEDTDDDDHPDTSGRLLPWSNCLLHFFDAWLLGHPPRYCKDRLPARTLVAVLTTGKYITYRAIRI